MHEIAKKARRRGIRRGMALCLTILLTLPLCMGTAGAAECDGAAARRTLIPVGHTVGIKLFSRGVLVVNLADGSTPASRCGLSKGDLILQCSGTSVTSTEQFQSLLQDSEGDTVKLKVRHGGTVRTLETTPVQNEEGDWVIGAWIRDSMAGIGTVTYYDPAGGAFGALGHGISDPDTAQLMPFAAGSVLPSTVKAVKKGTAGTAGELRGDFDLSGDSGTLRANTDCGIFGTMTDPDFAAYCGEALPVASAAEVHPGKATILANVSGDEIREYAIEISRVASGSADGRELVLRVTDPELLKATGGIVQGMSGSPILQDGRFAGAVTHVLLSDPSKGYGILLETMLNAAEKN